MRTNAESGNRAGTTFSPDEAGLANAMDTLGEDGQYLVNKMHGDGNVRQAAAYHAALADIEAGHAGVKGDDAARDAALKKKDALMAIGSTSRSQAHKAVSAWEKRGAPASTGTSSPPKPAPKPVPKPKPTGVK
jgi:hypothetical protein